MFCPTFRQNAAGTGYNVTLNLTGPILLGLAVALAVSTYMYIQAFKSWGNFDHRDDFYYDRQFILKVGVIGWND